MINDLYNIERYHQLHTELTVTYVVDGYEATLTAEEAYLKSPRYAGLGFPLTAHGESIIQALVNLNGLIGETIGNLI